MKTRPVTLLFLTGLLFIASARMGYSATTKNYGNLTLTSPWYTTHWNDVWDLTQGDLTLSYTINMTGLHQPGNWSTYDGSTSYTEVGLRGEGAGDFNPGPWNTYQGNCGGWMTSDSDTWLDSDGYTENGNPDPDSIQDLDDKHNLGASGGRGECDYDVLDGDGVYGYDSNWDIIQSPPIGSFDNFGIWFDRDGVDPWQALMWGNLGPGGVGSGDGLRYNTGGIYDIVITYHAIDDGLGVMFATVNGYPTGFICHPDAEPDYYPAGLSFKGDMKHMQVFAGLWAPDATYGDIVLTDITVSGVLGVSDPLVPDFTYTIPIFAPPYTVYFTDDTHGGMPPYSYSWDFNDDGITDSTLQKPTWDFLSQGDYIVKLTVTPHRCVTKSITKTIHIAPPPPVGGLWIPINKTELLAPWTGLASLITVAAASIIFVKRRKKKQN